MNSETNFPSVADLQKARMEIICVTNSIMREYQIPAGIAEGILCSVLSDLRAQTALDIANEAGKTEAELYDLQNKIATGEIEELISDE